MSTIEIVQLVVTIFLTVVIALAISTTIVLMVISTRRYFKMKEQMMINHTALEQIKNDNRVKAVEYTERTLSMVRTIIGQIAVLKFRSFKDSQNMDKVTESILRGLAKNVAETAEASFNRSNISFDDAIFTEKFFNQYIVDVSFTLIKDMHNKYEEENL